MLLLKFSAKRASCCPKPMLSKVTRLPGLTCCLLLELRPAHAQHTDVILKAAS